MELQTNEVTIPDEVVKKWQNIVDILADIMNVPVALIMRVVPPRIEVFLTSNTDGNPYSLGDSEHLEGSGLYCETVIKSQSKLEVPNALKDKARRNNPDIKLGMISYLGLPINWPDGKIFGTICVLDKAEKKHDDRKVNYFTQLKELVEMHLAIILANETLKKSLAEKAELLAKNAQHIEEIETINKLCMDREKRIIEIKQEVNALLAGLGKDPKYLV